jgi:hypothetical protein
MSTVNIDNDDEHYWGKLKIFRRTDRYYYINSFKLEINHTILDCTLSNNGTSDVLFHCIKHNSSPDITVQNLHAHTIFSILNTHDHDKTVFIRLHYAGTIACYYIKNRKGTLDYGGKKRMRVIDEFASAYLNEIQRDEISFKKTLFENMQTTDCNITTVGKN